LWSTIAPATDGMPSETFLRKGVTYSVATKEVVDCLFCRIINGKEPANFVNPLQPNPNLVAFRTINPATSTHLLITPRKHIANVASLTKAEVPLLQEMKTFGLSLLSPEQRERKPLLVFHCPPWNSIDHLHLHVIADPSRMSFFNAFFKYQPLTLWCTDVDSLINKLQQGSGGGP